MEITFLGTGTSQGVPVIACDCDVCRSIDFRDKRLRTSALLEVDGTILIFDTGPDFRTQMLRERVSKLDAVLFTHAHKDHTAGMDDIRSFNFKQRTSMPIYGTPMVFDQLKKEFAYIFQDLKYPGVPKVELHELNSEPFKVNGVSIQPIEVLHLQLPVMGFRIKDFTYITDANHISDESKEKIHGSEVLVLNALQKSPHISHFNLEEALAMIGELKPGSAYLTHISHKMGLHAEVEKELPDNVFLAYDGLKIQL